MRFKVNPFNKYLTPEQHLQMQVIEYIRYQYPNILFFHTPNEGRKTPFERYLFQIMGGVSGVPDLIILEPRKQYHGLFIEIKTDKGKPTENQLKFIDKLQTRNYFATFAYGFEEAKEIINNYLNN